MPVQGTGFDFADFLLGMPQSASIQYSPAMYFTQNNWNGYVLDDWKVSANLTLNLGLRYEFFAPLQEKYNEMANLDIAPGFTNVARRRAFRGRTLLRLVSGRPDQSRLPELLAARGPGIESAVHQALDHRARGLRDLLQRASPTFRSG